MLTLTGMDILDMEVYLIGIKVSFPDTGLGRNAIIFGVDMSSPTKIDNRKKDILILVKVQHKD